MAIMPIHEAMEDDPADYDGGTAHRARAKMMLDQIARQARQALDEQQIDLDPFFMVPNSGDAIITYGTTADPDDELWTRVGTIVSEVVRDLVGVRRTRCQAVVYAHAASTDRSPAHTNASVQQRGAGE
jgi:hypothetical protein